MRDYELIKKEEIRKDAALDLFADLIGRVAMNHEFLNRVIRSAVKSIVELSSFSFEQDVADRMINASSSELRSNFVSGVSATFKRLTPELQDSPEFSGWVSELDQMLKEENRARNLIVHSIFDLPPGSTGVDEMLGKSLASHRKGRYAVNSFNRNWLIEFIGFQRSLLLAVELVVQDVEELLAQPIELNANLFDQSAMLAPSEEESSERADRIENDLATAEWLVYQYLGIEILGRARSCFKTARVSHLRRFYSD